METSNKRLIKVVQVQSIAIAILFLAVSALVLNKFSSNETKNGIITTQGIIIVDADGNERILIGAPIPQSKDRIRDDLQKVEQAYGDWFPPESNFMSIYKEKVNNEAYGMVILDEHGYDKLAIGDPVPDLYYGQRIGPSTGIIINDSTGTERSGYGLIKLKDRYMVSLGFDRNDGYEGMVLSLDDIGETKIRVSDQSLNQSVVIGESLNKSLFGIQYNNSNDSLNRVLNFNK